MPLLLEKHKTLCFVATQITGAAVVHNLLYNLYGQSDVLHSPLVSDYRDRLVPTSHDRSH
jgi:hypothetical protein